LASGSVAEMVKMSSSPSLTLVDNFTHESLAIEVGEHIGSDRVVEVLTQLSKSRDLPKRIQVDNSPEFKSKRLD